jgi:hypothetical protein
MTERHGNGCPSGIDDGQSELRFQPHPMTGHAGAAKHHGTGAHRFEFGPGFYQGGKTFFAMTAFRNAERALQGDLTGQPVIGTKPTQGAQVPRYRTFGDSDNAKEVSHR